MYLGQHGRLYTLGVLPCTVYRRTGPGAKSKHDCEKAAWITNRKNLSKLIIYCDPPKSSHATKTAQNPTNRMGEINPYSGSAAQIFPDSKSHRILPQNQPKPTGGNKNSQFKAVQFTLSYKSTYNYGESLLNT